MNLLIIGTCNTVKGLVKLNLSTLELLGAKMCVRVLHWYCKVELSGVPIMSMQQCPWILPAAQCQSLLRVVLQVGETCLFFPVVS